METKYFQSINDLKADLLSFKSKLAEENASMYSLIQSQIKQASQGGSEAGGSHRDGGTLNSRLPQGKDLAIAQESSLRAKQ